MNDSTVGHPLQILLADDSAFTRKLLARQLDEIFPGSTVTPAEDGDAAISAVKKLRGRGEEFDLILLDYMMPGKTGLDVLAFIRETDQSVPVYIVTANVQTATRDKAFELGCTDFLNKTLNAKALRDQLKIGETV